MRTRHHALTALTALAVLAVVGVPSFSSATFTSTSEAAAVVQGAVDWTPPTVSLSAPGSLVHGTVVLTASAADAETGVAEMQIQLRRSGATAWTPLCTATSTTLVCSWDSRAVADGGWELRAVATDRAGYGSTSAVVTTTVRNEVALDLGLLPTYVRGSVPLPVALTAADGAVDDVVLQWRAVGSTSWQPACTGTACSWDTTGLTSGPYEVRAQALAGSQTLATSAVRGTTVDNTTPSLTLTAPGPTLSGSVALSGTASDAHSGLASVRVQYAPAASGAYTDVCTATTASFSCAWDTTAVPNGPYDLRAVATDALGNSRTVVLTGRHVANLLPLRGEDVQAVNGSGVRGRIDAGDTVTLTYNQPVRSTSLLAGWDGGARAVTVVVSPAADGTDVLEVRTTSGAVIPLGSVALRASHVPGNTTLSLQGTLTLGLDATGRSVATVVLGAGSKPQQQTIAQATTLVWTPSSSALTPDGRPAQTSTATESGPADVDF